MLWEKKDSCELRVFLTVLTLIVRTYSGPGLDSTILIGDNCVASKSFVWCVYFTNKPMIFVVREKCFWHHWLLFHNSLVWQSFAGLSLSGGPIWMAVEWWENVPIIHWARQRPKLSLLDSNLNAVETSKSSSAALVVEPSQHITKDVVIYGLTVTLA